MSDKQPWLKSMEHGALGEARAKAFLLERFWALERSVDIQGADYLIQRSLTSENFLEREPPSLGVVQVKFIQDGRTTISIKKDYLCDDSGSPYKEFFLLVFSGREDEARSFLYSAKEVLENFVEKIENGQTKLKLAGSKVLNNGNFEVRNKQRALDRIEHALKNADFLSNRKFLGTTRYVKIAPEHIDEDYILPLRNAYANFQREFFNNKKSLQSTMFEMEDVLEAMNKILESTDPEAAFQIFDEVIEPNIGASSGDSLVFRVNCFDDWDLREEIKSHKVRLAEIRKLKVEQAYFDLVENYVSQVARQCSKLPVDKGDQVKVVVKYDSDTLKNSTILVESVSAEEDTPFVAKSDAGHNEIYFSPWEWFSYETRVGTVFRPKSEKEIEQAFKGSYWNFLDPFVGEVEKHLIGEANLSPSMRRY